jgi:hypothetical protein
MLRYLLACFPARLRRVNGCTGWAGQQCCFVILMRESRYVEIRTATRGRCNEICPQQRNPLLTTLRIGPPAAGFAD